MALHGTSRVCQHYYMAPILHGTNTLTPSEKCSQLLTFQPVHTLRTDTDTLHFTLHFTGLNGDARLMAPVQPCGMALAADRASNLHSNSNRTASPCLACVYSVSVRLLQVQAQEPRGPSPGAWRLRHRLQPGKYQVPIPGPYTSTLNKVPETSHTSQVPIPGPYTSTLNKVPETGSHTNQVPIPDPCTKFSSIPYLVVAGHTDGAALCLCGRICVRCCHL